MANKLPLTNGDTDQALEVVWEALFSHRENCIPEGVDNNDEQWDEICTAMAWITETLHG